jgi:plastocyanin
MHPAGVANAWVFASTSKVPFYIAGVALAGWAVLIAFFGSTHPDFPGTAMLGRLVMLVSVALVATTITAAVLTGSNAEHKASAAAPGGAGATGTLRLTADPGGLPAYDVERLTTRAGAATIDFANPSPVPHNVTIAAGTRTLAATPTVTGADTSVTTRLTPGSYAFFCSVDAHRQAGMRGILLVR